MSKLQAINSLLLLQGMKQSKIRKGVALCIRRGWEIQPHNIRLMAGEKTTKLCNLTSAELKVLGEFR